MSARRIAVAVLCVGGAIGVFVLLAVAMGSAHRRNPVHQRMGVLAVDRDRVAVRYVPCADERIEWIELTWAEDGRGVSLWRADDEATTAALSAAGLVVPMALEAGHTYEIVVHTTRGEGGQEIEDGPPGDGEMLVRDERVTAGQYADAARESCED